MRKLLNIASWLGGMALLIVLMSFGYSSRHSLPWQGTQVTIHRSTPEPLVTEAEVWQRIEKYYQPGDSITLAEINIGLLEESLENHPSIVRSEVYWSLRGELYCELWQHRPLARVRQADSAYYLLTKGEAMPLSPHYSAPVPHVTGALNDSVLIDIASFWEHVEGDAFFAGFFTGIERRKSGEWLLHPRPGHHQVRLGNPGKWREKLARLKIFYQTMVTPEYLDSLKTIDLRFQDQVICRKK